MAAETGLDAAWRTERRSWQELLAKILTSGENVSPLLMVPFAAMRILMLDWLHCVDLGVAAEFIGQMIRYFIVQKKVPGGELCASGGDPAKHWNYRDEDFGGAVAHFGRRRGGPQSTREFSRGCMTKFMGQPVVRLMR